MYILHVLCLSVAVLNVPLPDGFGNHLVELLCQPYAILKKMYAIRVFWRILAEHSNEILQ